MVYTHFVELYIHDFVDLYGGEKNRRGVAEQYYKREADWKEAGEERRDERAWILSDNISVTSESEELLVLSAISYIISTRDDHFYPCFRFHHTIVPLVHTSTNALVSDPSSNFLQNENCGFLKIDLSSLSTEL